MLVLEEVVVSMAGPYRCTNMIVKVNDQILGVVEGLDIDLSYEGGVEHHYGSREGKHSVGGKRATFTIRRWFMADTDTDLLFDLFHNRIPFSLYGYLIDDEGNPVSNSQIMLSNCIIYRWRPRTGAANDIIGEEASGQATAWYGLSTPS